MKTAHIRMAYLLIAQGKPYRRGCFDPGGPPDRPPTSWGIFGVRSGRIKGEFTRNGSLILYWHRNNRWVRGLYGEWFPEELSAMIYTSTATKKESIVYAFRRALAELIRSKFSVEQYGGDVPHILF